MPILPPGSFLTFNASATLFVTDIVYTPTFQLYTNWAYQNQRLRSAKEDNGAVAQFFTLNGGTPAQAMVICGSVTPRPLGPDNITLINRQFVVDKYTIKGDCSLSSQVAMVTTYAKQHRVLLETFAAAQNAQGVDLSYNQVVAYQTIITNAAIALTTAGSQAVTVVGNALASTKGIITQFTFDVDYEIPNTGQVFYTWSMELESRTESAAG